MEYVDYLGSTLLGELGIDKDYKLNASNVAVIPDVKQSVLNYKRKSSLVLDEKHIKTILQVVTDKEWNELNVDLYWIRYKDFLKLYFWEWTWYPRTSWKSLTRQYFLSNNEWRYKLLEVWWIKREDFSNVIINYSSRIIIKVLLDVVRNNLWKKVWHNDFNVIWVREFSRLYFWFWTKYWKITWKELIEKVWSLEMVLELYWIKR